MRKSFSEKVEAGRVRAGRLASTVASGQYGAFKIHGPCGETLAIVSSGAEPDDPDAYGWQHVSVSTYRRLPNWIEMCFVKDLFFEPEECVVQFHPPESVYVNNHRFCLHLWKPPYPVELPPSILVGVKAIGIETPEQAAELEKEIGR